MDNNIVIDLDRYYSLANKIAGEQGNDLLHTVLLSFENKRNLKGDDLFRYVTRILKNEAYRKDSNFNKQFNPCADVDFDYENTKCYDTVQLYEILEQLRHEGHEYKVNMFLDVMSKKTTVYQIAKEMQVSRMYIYRNFITFVKNEIKKRYVVEQY